jgi:8'-apo-carotenoid 13,14-cleaving dioxygenase
MASAVESFIRGSVTKGISKLASFNRERMKELDKPHPYLTGIHKPVSQEFTLETLRVSGEIPAQLNGRYLRNGPNPLVPPKAAAYHWFMGDAMIHGLRLEGGKALWYKNRWVRSSRVSQALGEPEAPGPRSAMFDNPNTNIVGHAKQIWAVVEAGGFPARLDKDLNTIAHDPFSGTLKGSFSAHPHVDPDTGEMHAICYLATNMETIHHVVVSPEGLVTRREPIAVKHGPMIHDCMITKNYVLVLDLPVTFSMKQYMAGQGFPYAWNPEHRARVGVLPKNGKGSEIVWCEVEPCYVYHPSNAFEDEQGNIVLDACVHNSMFANSTQGPDSQSVPFERWHIDLTTKRVTRRVIDAHSQEFPRPNESLMGKPYRYAYTVALPNGGDAAFLNHTQLFKQDLKKGTKQVHDFGAGRVPGEFVFVPKASAQEEDAGWLMGYVVNTLNDSSDFVILDAQRFEGPAQAVVHLPHRIPPGFHGNWIAEEA